jgi:hypothetical protein
MSRKYWMNVNPKTIKKLEEIAMTTSCTLVERGGIDVRNNDREDFPEIEITGLQAMLEDAYRLGLEDGKKLV